MSEAQTSTNVKDWIYDHRKPLMAVLALIAVILLIIGLSLTWFVNSKSLSTVGKIQEPAPLRVLGPNQTAIEQISLSYDEAMKDTFDDAKNTATIRRGFCVQSDGSGFELQIANTTNISGLQIKIYRVIDTNASPEEATIAGVSGTTTYSWKKADQPTDFALINPANPGDESLAEDLKDKDDPTYENYKNVQKNARPLYRYKKFDVGDLDKDKDGNPAAATNFIIECTWNTKPNVKETDVVYLIARTS